jgi:hypothetical protein
VALWDVDAARGEQLAAALTAGGANSWPGSSAAAR